MIMGVVYMCGLGELWRTVCGGGLIWIVGHGASKLDVSLRRKWWDIDDGT